MANARQIAKAKALGITMEQVSGVSPSYDYQDNFVRIYYEPDRLRAVQAKLESWTRGSDTPSDVRVDWLPMVTPLVIKKTLPVAIGIFALGYLLGSK